MDVLARLPLIPPGVRVPVPRRRLLGLVGLLALAVPLALTAATPASAADKAPTHRVPLAKVLRGPTSGPTSKPRAVRATRTPAASRPPVSNWQVTYCGFDAYPQAKQPFQAAVDIWAGLIDTPNDNVPIKVKATFKNLHDPDVLGQAG